MYFLKSFGAGRTALSRVIQGRPPLPPQPRRSLRNKSNVNINEVLSSILGLDKMPKDERHLFPLRSQRLGKRKKAVNEIPHAAYFQVLGNGSPGGTSGLLFYTETQKYLFNCGEGVQRLSNEYCATRTLSELGHILVTAKSWKNIGGLLGMCLSARASGAPDITVHGPKGTVDVYDATKGFIILHDFDVLRHDVDDPPLDTSALRIEHVPIRPSSSSKPPRTPLSEWNDKNSPVPFKGDRGNSIFSNDAAFDTPYDRSVVAYVVTVKPKAGKLLFQKCVDFGVPPGPLLGELKNGRDVVLDCGRTVRSCDVIDKESSPLSYVVIEIPDADYLDCFVAERRLSAERLTDVQAVFHFTPVEVFESEAYKGWVDSFHESVRHVIMNESNEGLGSHDILSFSRRLHRINPKVFSRLSPERVVPAPKAAADGRFIYPSIGDKLHVRPNLNVTERCASVVDVEAIDAEVGAVQEVWELQRTIAGTSDEEKRYPRVTFLGTGSSVPSKYRCISSILVETRPGSFVMLDCGEGTVLQLHRLYGVEGARAVLRGLDAVYVSHLHADHHLGFINLVQQREEAFRASSEQTRKLYLLAPAKMATYLLSYHLSFEPVLQNVYRVKNEHLIAMPRQHIYPEVLEEVCRHCGLEKVVMCRAVHCGGSFSVALTIGGGSGFKLVYSGDTRPNEQLIFLGVGADLLIHEATMEHHLLADCRAKRHSTFTEAINEGRAMNAKFTLLTHFSQRYSKLPMMDEMEGCTDVGAAWDFMTVDSETVKLIRPSYPALKAVFSDDLELMVKRKADFLRGPQASLVLNNLDEDLDGDSNAIELHDEPPIKKRTKKKKKMV